MIGRALRATVLLALLAPSTSAARGVSSVASAPRAIQTRAALRFGERVELSLGAGFYRTDRQGDLGDPEQTNHLRLRYQDAWLGALSLRAAYALTDRLSLGVLLGVAPGTIHSRAAALLSYRLELIFHLLVGPVMPFVTASGGGLTLTTPPSVLGTDTDPAGAWGAGVKIALGRRFRLRLDFAHVLTDPLNSVRVAQHFELTAGVALVVAPPPPPPDPDRDGDGLPNAADRCPDEPEDPDGFADDDGCPDPDNDGDGVVDVLERRPDGAGRPAIADPR